MQVAQDIVYADISVKPCLSTQRSPPEPRMETIEFIADRDT